MAVSSVPSVSSVVNPLDRSRRNALLVCLISALGLGASVVPMAHRISDFNTASHYARFHAEIQSQRDFQIGVFPRVLLTDFADDRGRTFLKLDYAGTEHRVPVHKPAAPNVPDLGIYDEWVKVLAVNQVQRDPATGQSSPVPGTDRLLVVSRITPEGLDPESWGAVHRNEWLFRFFDLRRDGSVDEETWRWPMAKDEYEKAFQKRAAAPDADPALKAIAAVPVLKERTVEYFAAMHVIPKLNVPKYKFTDTAFNFTVLGWTLPVSMLSGLALTIGVFFIFAPLKSVQRRTGKEATR